MQQQSSNVAIYVALTLAAVAAIASMPASGRDVETKALWLLTTQATTDDAGGAGMDQSQMMGMP
jgi:hypothetical protein